MEFFHRAQGRPACLGVLPGSFNPVTVAHLALAEAGLTQTDEILFVLPRIFPHKDYSGAAFEDRVAMLRAAIGPHCSIARTRGGLFLEIARECREAYGEDVRLSFLCGTDAAERIVGWDYGRPGAAAEMLREFELLVAARQGVYQPPEEFRHAIRTLELTGEFDHVSATEVRERIARGDDWEPLVPEAARALARRIYR
jgi:nicotinate (nicotinamide) nucleotide adenylyltransferase